MRKLNEVLTLNGYGIFQAIQERLAEVIPYLETPADVDKLYLMHSGEKLISRGLELYLNEYPILKDALLNLSDMIILKFKPSWDRIYEALSQQYNPLENYDSHEDETEGTKATSNSSSNMSDKSTATGKSKATNKNSVYGFNSTTGAPKDEGVAEGSNEANTLNTTEGNTNETHNEDHTRQLHRHGNIGVTTSAQMLTGEIDVRIKYRMYDILMNDVDTILALKAY